LNYNLVNGVCYKPTTTTAKKDIAVYKMLKENKDFLIKVDKLKELKHGDSFKGIINKTECEGKVSINDNKEIYFCTNEEKLNGNRTSDRFGYKYSWIKDTNLISKIIVNDEIIFEKIYITVGYKTPYQETEIKIGETYISKLIKNNDRVEEGLHSFATLKDAKALTIIVSCRYNYVIAKCVIPKGSRYYKGKFDTYTSYASDTLSYVEIIK
jgi:hypothetical protein